MNPKTPMILLVDDNADVRQTVRAGLERDGYAVTSASSAREMMEKLKDGKPDAILLDLILPDEDGLGMMAKIREYTNVPVIVVSGRGDLVDKVTGLEMGADDYVSKPFQIKELAARIKAHLRRHRKDELKAEQRSARKTADVVKFDRWTMDRRRLQVFDEEGRPLGLTVKEFRLLEIFVSFPNEVLSRDQLLDRSRMDGFSVTDRAIDTQIVRIRKKLGAGADGSPIQAVRGAGYIFNAPVVTDL
jgi:DNA-binding response OmpR family regulator